jgi:2-haloacid dehalogenase
MKYDLVLLDADGTLFDFDAAAASAFRVTCAEAGIVGDQTLFERYLEINHALWAALECGEIDKESLKAERFRRLFAERAIVADAMAFSGRYLEHLAEGSQLLEGAETFVRTVERSGADLAIITNGISSVQRGRFFRSPLAALIPHLFISEELGAEKPATGFFSEAFRRLGRDEAEKAGVIVMGDSWSADIVGALGFGLDALWFNPAGKSRPEADTLRPDTSIAAGGRHPILYEAASYAEALGALGVVGSS